MASGPTGLGPGLAIQNSRPGDQAVNAASARNIYIEPQHFGQHLMFNGYLNPQVPVHAMRLWDSNTQWCQMDGGTASGQYNFAQLDNLFSQASRVGADVEFTFGYTPQWAASRSYPQRLAGNQCSSSTQALPPADESYWTRFVTALVTHSKGKIHAYELWNEFDLAGVWSGSIPQMVRMSVDAAAIIHAIDPSALVLSPSVTDSPAGYEALKEYLSSLPQGTIDAIAVHSYTNGNWPEAAVPAEMQGVRAALPAAYSNTPLWSTEGGWGQNSQFSSAAPDQRAFVARYDLLMLAQGFARNYWYAYPNTQWGTLSAASALTPAGVATRTLESWLPGATLGGCSTSDGNLWICNLTTSDGKKAQIVWATTWQLWYPTTGYSTKRTLDGSASSATGWIQATSEPVLLSN